MPDYCALTDEYNAISARIEKFRSEGRPVPMILEVKLSEIRAGKKKKLPVFARRGMFTDAQRKECKMAKRFR